MSWILARWTGDEPEYLTNPCAWLPTSWRAGKNHAEPVDALKLPDQATAEAIRDQVEMTERPRVYLLERRPTGLFWGTVWVAP